MNSGVVPLDATDGSGVNPVREDTEAIDPADAIEARVLSKLGDVDPADDIATIAA